MNDCSADSANQSPLPYTVVLIPVDTDPATINRISDVMREGGRIVTDPIGGYGSPVVMPGEPAVKTVPNVAQH